MKDEFYTTDYDIRVGDISVAHENALPAGGMWRDYSVRRGFAGFVLSLEGEATYRTKDTVWKIGKNQLAYFPADCAYVIEVPTGGKPFRHFTVNFTLGEVTGSQMVKDLLFAKTPYITDVSEHAMIKAYFPQLVSIWRDRAPGYRMRARELLYGMLHGFVSHCITEQMNPDLVAHVMPAKKMIDEHFNEDLTISAMAEMCDLSETHFRRCFLAAFGMSPIAYRTNLRIERAKDLLLGSWYSIGEIAQMTGFSDISFFSRFFTRHTGLTPSVFRHEHGDANIRLK